MRCYLHCLPVPDRWFVALPLRSPHMWLPTLPVMQAAQATAEREAEELREAGTRAAREAAEAAADAAAAQETALAKAAAEAEKAQVWEQARADVEGCVCSTVAAGARLLTSVLLCIQPRPYLSVSLAPVAPRQAKQEEALAAAAAQQEELAAAKAAVEGTLAEWEAEVAALQGEVAGLKEALAAAQAQLGEEGGRGQGWLAGSCSENRQAAGRRRENREGKAGVHGGDGRPAANATHACALPMQQSHPS